MKNKRELNRNYTVKNAKATRKGLEKGDQKGVEKVNTTTKTNNAIPSPGESVCHPRISMTRKNTNSSLSRNKGKCLDIETRETLGNTAKCKANDEICMIDNSSLSSSQKESIKKKFFRPKMPYAWKKKPDTWLNNGDIEAVMKQYEEAYPFFKFMGVAPIDFSAPDPYIENNGSDLTDGKCVVDSFCRVNLKEMKSKGKTIIGTVFNLDPHYKGGSHWVSLVITEEGVYYFDSYGYKPPEQIARFMRSLILQNPSLKLGFCKRRFQYRNTECGMYSLYFIIRMITGTPFKEFCKHSIPDAVMLKFRKVLFRE